MHEEDATPAVDKDDLAELREQLARLENRVKESQSSLFSAIKTLLHDFEEYRDGTRDINSLRPAIVGLVFAYLRPRLVIVVGSLLAGVLGVAQLWLLWNQQKQLELQNTLISQQGNVLEAQTKASQEAVISQLVLALDPRDSIRSHLAQAQLATFGEAGFNVLLDLTHRSRGPASELAAGALYGQGLIQSPVQVVEVLDRWVYFTTADLRRIGLEGDVADYQFLISAPLFDKYLISVAARVESDTAFKRELWVQMMANNAMFSRHVRALYETYFTGCRPVYNAELDAELRGRSTAPNRAFCTVSEFETEYGSVVVSTTPPVWHNGMYILAKTLGDSSRTPPPPAAYDSLFQRLAQPGRTSWDELSTSLSTIEHWFSEPRPQARE